MDIAVIDAINQASNSAWKIEEITEELLYIKTKIDSIDADVDRIIFELLQISTNLNELLRIK